MGNRLGVDISGSLIRVSATLCQGDTHTQDGHTHDTRNKQEVILTKFILHSPTWGIPWLFDLPKDESGRRRRVYCFLLDLAQSDVFLWRAYAGINDLVRDLDLPTPYEFPVWVTGSGATLFAKRAEDFLNSFHKESGVSPPAFTIKFRFQRELQSILRSLDSLLERLPQLFFQYENTLQGVTDAGAIPAATVFRPKLLEAAELDDFYPYLLVNMKAGVSFHRVSSATESVRIGGSPIGCATFVGLTRLLCGSSSSPFDAFLFAQEGDQSTVDMLVKDIYGGDYESVGLKGSIVASTLGKLQNLKPSEDLGSVTGCVSRDGTGCVMHTPRTASEEGCRASIPLSAPHLEHFSSPTRDGPAVGKGRLKIVMGLQVRDVLGEGSSDAGSDTSPSLTLKPPNMSRVASTPNIHLNGVRRCHMEVGVVPSEADVAKSLLSMMSFNVAQLAYFNAQLHNIKRIVFIGYYLETPGYLAAIQHCVDFWSHGQCQVHFVRVAPFLGCFGATLEKRYCQESVIEDLDRER
eukprot:Blabericola_migrator_1__4350@NODE_233_length_11060_cov_144_333303_g198_i0_p2_GENE_NODE_233_length_11060_cov_144_333303_g198_i0NODE_233_length_11060_cov_144_333303_g198_i0_p2_ORF_typecomplete_len520_score103_44Fumble/PF03630_14/3_2e65_NODE_233_length_11060_cov_144_333303_g198_i012442803